MSVDFPVEHYDLLGESLDRLRLPYLVQRDGQLLVTVDGRETITIGNGVVRMDPRHQEALNGIKRAYTRRVIEEVAGARRMTIIDDPDDPDHITLRSYAT